MKTKVVEAFVRECPALEFLKSDHYEPSYATSNAIRFLALLIWDKDIHYYFCYESPFAVSYLQNISSP